MRHHATSSGHAAASMALAVALLACDGNETSRTKGDAIGDAEVADADTRSGSRSGSGGSGGGSAGAAGAADDGAPTWSGIYTHVFRTCRIDTCHGGGLADLDFSTQDAAWRSLVDHPPDPPNACGTRGKLRVVPSDPDNSLLYLKLDINPPCGSQMPPGGQLPQVSRDRIRAWIEMGAQND